MPYPKRLIEVDLPIKRISAHARREKSIRHGHISTLHIWWARRPLAACRAVICAALWPDPADENCPPVFRKAAAKIILDFARKVTKDTKLANDHCSPENFKLWQKLTCTSAPSLQPLALRQALLDFIADFANWDNSSVKEYLDTSRALTQAAHEALGGAPGTRGVANGLLAYVAKTAKGEYKPFCFNQALMTTDIDFSDKMFLITKETAEAYLKSKATPGAPAAEPKPGEPPKKPEPPPQDPGGKKTGDQKKPEQLTFANMAWTGEVPPQKWMKFYTAVLSKFAAGNGLKLKLTVQVAPEGGISKQKIEETKAALRELGLCEDVKVE